MSVEQSRHLQTAERKYNRADERGVAGIGYVAIAGALGGAIFGIVAGLQHLPHLFDQERNIDVQSGEASLKAVRTDAPEKCFWEFTTTVEGARVKVEVKNNLNVPDKLPFVPDEINVTPGMWNTAEFNGDVVNKVCSPAGSIVPKKNSEGTYDLVFKPQKKGEQAYRFTSYINPGQPPIKDPNGVLLPLYIHDSGGLWAATKAEEWFLNKAKDQGLDKLLGAKKYKGDAATQYSEYVVSTEAIKNSARCFDAAYEMGAAGIRQNYLNDFLAQNPDLSEDDVASVELPTAEINEIRNQYGALGEFEVLKGAEVSVDSAEIDTSKCETGRAIDQSPEEARAEVEKFETEKFND